MKVEKIKEWIKEHDDSEADSLAARLGRMSRVRNGRTHADLLLVDAVSKMVERCQQKSGGRETSTDEGDTSDGGRADRSSEGNGQEDSESLGICKRVVGAIGLGDHGLTMRNMLNKDKDGDKDKLEKEQLVTEMSNKEQERIQKPEQLVTEMSSKEQERVQMNEQGVTEMKTEQWVTLTSSRKPVQSVTKLSDDDVMGSFEELCEHDYAVFSKVIKEAQGIVGEPGKFPDAEVWMRRVEEVAEGLWRRSRPTTARAGVDDG